MNAPDKLPLNTANTKAAAGQSHFHGGARAEVAGAVNYIDDIPEVKGTLFAAPILSNVAHGRLLGVDATAALAMPGVRGVVLAADVPGDPLLATFVHDEPIFAVDTLQPVGQLTGPVVADIVNAATRAAPPGQLDNASTPAAPYTTAARADPRHRARGPTRASPNATRADPRRAGRARRSPARADLRPERARDPGYDPGAGPEPDPRSRRSRPMLADPRRRAPPPP